MLVFVIRANNEREARKGDVKSVDVSCPTARVSSLIGLNTEYAHSRFNYDIQSAIGKNSPHYNGREGNGKPELQLISGPGE